MLNRPTFGGHISVSRSLLYMDGLLTDVIGYVWLGSVGTSSDSVPPNATRRAPPVHEATGGHAIQTYPITSIVLAQYPFDIIFLML